MPLIDPDHTLTHTCALLPQQLITQQPLSIPSSITTIPGHQQTCSLPLVHPYLHPLSKPLTTWLNMHNKTFFQHVPCGIPRFGADDDGGINLSSQVMTTLQMIHNKLELVMSW